MLNKMIYVINCNLFPKSLKRVDGAPSGQKPHTVVGSPANIAGKSSLQTPEAQSHVSLGPMKLDLLFLIHHHSYACLHLHHSFITA